jgi:hypothetical protein
VSTARRAGRMDTVARTALAIFKHVNLRRPVHPNLGHFDKCQSDESELKYRAAHRTRSYGFYGRVLRVITRPVGTFSRTLDGPAFDGMYPS